MNTNFIIDFQFEYNGYIQLNLFYTTSYEHQDQ
jgi:hypothetical protein